MWFFLDFLTTQFIYSFRHMIFINYNLMNWHSLHFDDYKWKVDCIFINVLAHWSSLFFRLKRLFRLIWILSSFNFNSRKLSWIEIKRYKLWSSFKWPQFGSIFLRWEKQQHVFSCDACDPHHEESLLTRLNSFSRFRFWSTHLWFNTMWYIWCEKMQITCKTYFIV